MKKIYLLLLTILVSLLQMAVAKAGETWTFQIKINPEDYILHTQEDFITVSSRHIDDFSVNGEPALPMRQLTIALPSYLAYEGMSVKSNDTELFSEGKAIAKVLQPIPTNSVRKSSTSPVKYTNPIEDYRIQYLGENLYDEVRILRFAVCPFKFEEDSNTLYLSKDIELSLELEEREITEDLPSISPIAAELLVESVINPEIIESIINSASPYVLDDDYILATNTTSGLDYLIITCSDFVSSFEELLEWKKLKGLRSRIVTTESIKATYAGSTMYEKIKRCIYTLYKEEGLSYVLLGGDTSIIPSPICMFFIGPDEEDRKEGEDVYYDNYQIHTDLFFACLSGQFDWDKDKNNMIGTVTDGCNLVPDVIVTRLHSSSPSEVSNSVKKIISYEKMPLLSYEPRMLLCGVQVDDKSANNGKPMCDTYYWAEEIYNTAVKPYWNNTVEYYFDSNSGTLVQPLELNNKFYHGYPFVSVYSHGAISSWPFDRNRLYSILMPNAIKDNGKPGTIINTVACYTNWFMSSYYKNGVTNDKRCLSQNFLSSPTSGVVGYFGSSDVGWYDDKNPDSLGPSPEYEAAFYTALFSNPEKNKSFGRITTKAKLSKISQSEEDEFYRFIQFALNPIGDPEMPIFINVPNSFSKVSVKQFYRLNRLYYEIDTGEAGCNICLSGTLNGEPTQVIFRNVQKIQTPYMPLNPTLCITKDHFVPYVRTGSAIMQAQDYGVTMMKTSDYIVGCNLSSSSHSLDVLTERESMESNTELWISDIMGNVTLTYDMGTSKIADVDVSSLSSGVYVVTMIVDGSPVDSCRILR